MPNPYSMQMLLALTSINAALYLDQMVRSPNKRLFPKFSEVEINKITIQEEPCPEAVISFASQIKKYFLTDDGKWRDDQLDNLEFMQIIYLLNQEFNTMPSGFLEKDLLSELENINKITRSDGDAPIRRVQMFVEKFSKFFVRRVFGDMKDLVDDLSHI